MKKFAKLLGLASNVPVVFDAAIPDPAAAAGECAEVRQIPVANISPNPFQPRKTFSSESLAELAQSIIEHGILQPLLVRESDSGFELVAGERRLRAARMVGLDSVPVIVRSFSDKDLAELAMIENLQREDLHFLEEAEGYHQLIENFSFTQEEMARRVGKNQSTVANKLRLLKLDEPVRILLSAEGLTERHARALLKLDDSDVQLTVLRTVVANNYNVRQTEELIEDISREIVKKKAPKQNVVRMIRDVRIYLNSINSVIAEMKKAGLGVKVTQEQDDEYITIQLKVAKRK